MDWLKISENTGDSWVAQHFSAAGKTPSATGAFLRFSCVKTLLTSFSVRKDVKKVGKVEGRCGIVRV